MNDTLLTPTQTQGGRTPQVMFRTSDPLADLAELANIVLNLRRHTAKFDQEYGANNKENKKRWEAKADEWIQKHRV